MESIARPRIVIAGTNSGVGKTTIVTGLLAYFHSKGYAVQPFKVGPDYIDPGFHGKAAGRNSYNLDTWMTPPDRLVPTFASLSKGADISIIEGVMGLYDGGANGITKLFFNATVNLQVDILRIERGDANHHITGLESACDGCLLYFHFSPVANAGVFWRTTAPGEVLSSMFCR